jgi:hypothetical protein
MTTLRIHHRDHEDGRPPQHRSPPPAATPGMPPGPWPRWESAQHERNGHYTTGAPSPPEPRSAAISACPEVTAVRPGSQPYRARGGHRRTRDSWLPWAGASVPGNSLSGACNCLAAEKLDQDGSESRGLHDVCLPVQRAEFCLVDHLADGLGAVMHVCRARPAAQDKDRNMHLG